MSTFLSEQAKIIFSKHQHEIDEISIIIPNKRAAIYLQKYLAEEFKRPFYAPEIVTINEWIGDHTSEKILSNIELLFYLYRVHCEIEKSNPETFEQFMLWGKTILSDFDELDKYLLNPEDVFRNLKDIKKLESWDLDTTEMGQAQLQFQQIWDKLGMYHSKLIELLVEAHATFSGRAYRSFLDSIEKLESPKHIYFLGFNAVSQVEEQIMHTLIKQERATAIFDIDHFYFDNEEHEAGYFYRKIIKDWDIKPNLQKAFNEIPKSFEIIETTQQVGQAKIGGTIVRELLNQGIDKKEIAVVLADETLLIPLSRSLPSNLETANITMGWPIKFSHLKSFLDLVFEFQFNFKKFKNSLLYHKTLTNFLQHPYVQEILEDNGIKEKIRDEITKGNEIFIEPSALIAYSAKFEKLAGVFDKWTDSTETRLTEFERLAQLLQNTFKDTGKRKIDAEIIYQFAQGLEKFKQILEMHKGSLSLPTFKMLFFQFWEAETLSFLGNPIEGVQVMGILETRALDFENLIILGMNEGVLPKPSQSNSFIPYDLREHLNLPVEQDRQAIFAHHFYRLLQRSKRVFLTYNSNSEGLGSGEKSRYIAQLENEVDLNKHQLVKYTFTGSSAASETNEEIYYSTQEVHARLDELLAKGLSPSALNTLIRCPLDFFYSYILKMNETEVVEENIESSTFGTKIHAVLEAIVKENFEAKDGTFRPLEIAVLQSEDKKDVIHKRLETAYLKDDSSKKFKKSDLKYGQNKLSFDVSTKFIASFLKQQIKELKNTNEAVIPIDLEKSISASYEINIAGETKSVKIRGMADRIDKVGDVHRILDYKSGKSDDSNLKLSQNKCNEDGIKELMRHDKKGHARQLLMYALMFRSEMPEVKKFQTGIISMVKLSDWIHYFNVDEDTLIPDDLLNLFEEELLDVIANLYHPDFEFKHDPKSLYCEHCGN